MQALEKAGRPMGPTSLYNFMVEQGMDLPDNANALGANLWAAAKAGRIVKTPNGGAGDDVKPLGPRCVGWPRDPRTAPHWRG